MINKDALREAKRILSESIDLKEYFNSYIDANEDLLTKTLVNCPLHDDDTASMKYFSETNSFYCFGCDKGGSVVDLHYYLIKRDKPSYTIVKAIYDLSRDYKIKIPDLFEVGKENILEKVARGYKKQNIKVDKVPVKVLQNNVENIIKENKGGDGYIELILEVDNIYMLEDYDRLLELNERGGNNCN